MNSSMRNYLMLPTEMSNKLKVYPIKVFDYEDFTQLFSMYFLLDIEDKNKQQYQMWEKNKRQGELIKIKEDNLFDWLINLINDTNQPLNKLSELKMLFEQMTEEQKQAIVSENPEFAKVLEDIKGKTSVLDDVTRLFEMLFRTKVEYDGEKFIVDGLFLDKGNFYEFRELVIENNLLIQPLIAPNLMSQKIIDNALKSKNKNGVKEDLTSIFSIVKKEFRISDDELMSHTYYRLMYDYKICCRCENNMLFYNYENFKRESLGEPIKMIDNPYEGLFSEHKNSSFDDKLSKK